MEDAARAIRIMFGAGLFTRWGYEDHAWDEFEAESWEEYQEQLVAYYDGAHELTEALAKDHCLPQTPWRQLAA